MRDSEKSLRERWKNSERGRERERAGESVQARKPEGGFDFILFHVPISRLVSSQTLTPSLSELPPRSLWPPPQLFPFILAVSCSGWGCGCPKPRDLPGSEKCRQQFVGDHRVVGEGGNPQHPSPPSQTFFLSQPLPVRGRRSEAASDKSWAGCRTMSAAGVHWEGVSQRYSGS